MRQILDSLEIGDGLVADTDCCDEGHELVFIGALRHPSEVLYTFASPGTETFWQIGRNPEDKSEWTAKESPSADYWLDLQRATGAPPAGWHDVHSVKQADPTTFEGFNKANEALEVETETPDTAGFY